MYLFGKCNTRKLAFSSKLFQEAWGAVRVSTDWVQKFRFARTFLNELWSLLLLLFRLLHDFFYDLLSYIVGTQGAMHQLSKIEGCICISCTHSASLLKARMTQAWSDSMTSLFIYNTWTHHVSSWYS